MTPGPPPRQLHGLPDGEMWEVKGEPDTRTSTPSSAIKTHFVGSRGLQGDDNSCMDCQTEKGMREVKLKETVALVASLPTRYR